MNLPAVPIAEIESITSRFIEFAKRVKDKGNEILEDSLL